MTTINNKTKGVELKMEKGKVLVLEHNKLTEVEVQLDNNGTVGYKAIKGCLHGAWIEHVTFNQTLVDNNVDMWVDEEGHVKGLDEELVIVGNSGIIEVLVGPVVFTSFDGRGNTLPLDTAQIALVQSMLRNTDAGVMTLRRKW